MDNLNELKTIWHTADVKKLPGPTAAKTAIKTFQARLVRKKRMLIVAATLLGVLVICATISTGSKMATTWIGGFLIATSGISLALNNWQSLKRFSQLDDCSNKEFLAFIDQTRENQRYYFAKTQGRLMLLCCIGLLLYLYETAARHPQWIAAIYLSCTAYLFVVWFIVRPRMFKRNARELENIHRHFEKLTHQLENYEE